MNSLPPNRWSADDFTELEQLISGAKEFVVPSPGFKARVVDSVSAIDHVQAHWAKLKMLFLLALAAWIIFALVFVMVSRSSGSAKSQLDTESSTSFSSSSSYQSPTSQDAP